MNFYSFEFHPLNEVSVGCNANFKFFLKQRLTEVLSNKTEHNGTKILCLSY